MVFLAFAAASWSSAALCEAAGVEEASCWAVSVAFSLATLAAAVAWAVPSGFSGHRSCKFHWFPRLGPRMPALLKTPCALGGGSEPRPRDAKDEEWELPLLLLLISENCSGHWMRFPDMLPATFSVPAPARSTPLKSLAASAHAALATAMAKIQAPPPAPKGPCRQHCRRGGAAPPTSKRRRTRPQRRQLRRPDASSALRLRSPSPLSPPVRLRAAPRDSPHFETGTRKRLAEPLALALCCRDAVLGKRMTS